MENLKKNELTQDEGKSAQFCEGQITPDSSSPQQDTVSTPMEVDIIEVLDSDSSELNHITEISRTQMHLRSHAKTNTRYSSPLKISSINALWEPPYAPSRFGRSLKNKRGKHIFSVGEFLSDAKPDFESKVSQACDQANDILFPHWNCPVTDFTLLDDLQAESFLPSRESNSPTPGFKFRYSDPESTKKSQEFHLIQFESHCKKRAGPGNPKKMIVDSILNVGGFISDLAWCPQSIDPASASIQSDFNNDYLHTYIAVAAHRDLESVHHVGANYAGEHGLIQIWDVGHLTNDGSTMSSIDEHAMPFMALGIAHEGGCVYDLKWCPRGSPCPTSEADFVPIRNDSDGELYLNRLGILAVAFGDGRVFFYAVPHPIALRQALQLERTDTKPIVVHLNPVHILALPSPDSMSFHIEWSPHNLCEHFAIGGSDGKVGVWRLPTSAEEAAAEPMLSPFPLSYTNDKDNDSSIVPNQSSMTDTDESQARNPLEEEVFEAGEYSGFSLPLYKAASKLVPFFFKKVHQTPIRAISWHPTDPFVFATCAVDHLVKIWDTRFPNNPKSTITLAAGTALDMHWETVTSNSAIIVGTDEGVLKCLLPSTGRTYYYHTASIFGVDASPFLKMQVSCDTNGDVFLMLRSDKRTRTPVPAVVCIEHITIESGFDIEGLNRTLYFSEDSVTCANEITPVPDEGTKSKDTKTPTPKKGKKTGADSTEEANHFKDRLGSLSKVRWNINASGASWIAYGGGAGLLRLQLLDWTRVQ